ncbi:MAG: hybrid sensor histidine kinase/response regulator [Verrucomicrobiota bacterium]
MVENQRDAREDGAEPLSSAQAVDLLLVEDNPAEAHRVEHALDSVTPAVFQFTHIDNIPEAIEYLASHKPDVLLLDLNVGESRGYETFEVLQQHTGGSIPIVISTELDDDDMALRAIRDGAQDYFPKGLTQTKGLLARIVRHAIQRHRDQEHLREINTKLAARQEALERALLDLKEVQRSVIETEKMKTVSRLAAGVAHEVKNPLQIIKMGMNYLAKQLPEENVECKNVAADIMVAVERGRDIISDLLNFAAPKQLQRETVSLEDVVNEAHHTALHELSRAHVSYTYAPEDAPAEVAIDRPKIVQVLVHLIANASHAMENTDLATMRIHAMQRPIEEVCYLTRKDEDALAGNPRDVVLIEVVDNGPGIPEEVLPKIFEPFFTTKDTGKGAGLGLCICRLIMDMHEGGVWMENHPDGGAVARIWWPIEQA